MQVVVFANEKGGVGKTTTTANFAAVAAASGLNVLAVDLDPQANLTVSLGHRPEGLERTIADLISPSLRDNHEPFDHIVIEGSTNDAGGRIDLLPMNGQPGETLERDMLNSISGLTSLREALGKVEDRYHLVAVDTPPRLNSPLLMTALVAADGVVGVMEPQVLPARGSDKFAAKVAEVQSSPLNPGLRFLGLLLNMYEGGEEARVIEHLLTEAGRPVLATRIPKSKWASKVLVEGMPPVAVAWPHLPIAAAYESLVEEILEALTKEA